MGCVRVVILMMVCAIMGCWASIELPERARGGLAWKQYQHRISGTNLPNADKRYITLPCDHNNPTGPTYQNKYYVDTTQTGGAAGPIFFIMGGEGAVGGIGASYISDLAARYKASIVAIEHRFYGESIPFGSMRTEYYKYLNVEQALSDVVSLISYLQSTLPGGPNLPVVAFGGSYSGGLSAWFRVAYPNVTVGSLSSSGVVNAILNFTAFDNQVGIAIGDACANTLRAVTRAFENAISSGQGARVKALLKATVLNDPDFFFMIADAQAMAPQYGNKANLCNAMAKLPLSDPEALMAGYADWSRNFYGDGFAADCYYDTQCLKSQESRWGFARSWRWQCCDQLAYLQTAPDVGSIRSRSQSLQYMIDQCVEIFGAGVYPRTVDFNNRYGGARPPATNVFFSDFSDDPWQRASVNTTLSPSLPYNLVVYDGAGHCADFHYPSASDKPQLTASRAQFEQFLKGWIAK